MPGVLVEPNVEAIWWSTQTAGKGTAATTAAKRGRKVSGSLPQINVGWGSENFSDGSRFNNATDFFDTIQGGGAPGIQAQSGPLANLLWAFCGQETVTGTGPFTHVITPAANSKWMTWWKRLGSTSVMREQYNDCRISQIVLEGSTGQRVIRITPTILSLDPGVIANADPVKVDDATEPLNYNQAQGAFKIDGGTPSTGTVITGHSAFSCTVTDDLTPYRGDSPFAMALAPGRGTVSINATILLDDQGLAQLYKLYYGSTSPSSGSRPITTVPSLGTYEATFTASANEQFILRFYGVRWTPPDMPDGDPGGGAITLSLAGGARIAGSNPMVEFTVKNNDAAYTA